MSDLPDPIDAADALFRVEAPVADWPLMKREIDEARRQATLEGASAPLPDTRSPQDP